MPWAFLAVMAAMAAMAAMTANLLMISAALPLIVSTDVSKAAGYADLSFLIALEAVFVCTCGIFLPE